VTAALPGAAVEAAHVVLPAAVFGEKAGTVRGPSAKPPSWPRPGAPRAGRPELAILEALAAALPERAGPGARGTGTCRDGARLLRGARPRPALRGARGGGPGAGNSPAGGGSLGDERREGSLTGQLSWARYAYPEPLLGLSTAHARALGVRAGDRVRVRSNWGQAELRVRIDAGLPEACERAAQRSRRAGAAALAARARRPQPRPAARPRVARAAGAGGGGESCLARPPRS